MSLQCPFDFTLANLKVSEKIQLPINISQAKSSYSSLKRSLKEEAELKAISCLWISRVPKIVFVRNWWNTISTSLSHSVGGCVCVLFFVLQFQMEPNFITITFVCSIPLRKQFSLFPITVLLGHLAHDFWIYEHLKRFISFFTVYILYVYIWIVRTSTLVRRTISNQMVVCSLDSKYLY